MAKFKEGIGAEGMIIERKKVRKKRKVLKSVGSLEQS
jgi:hypothetical protein